MPQGFAHGIGADLPFQQRLARLHPLWEATDTFLYSPKKITHAAAHVRDSIDLKRIMIIVWAATFPAMFLGMWNVGSQALTLLANVPGATPDQLTDAWRVWVIGLISARPKGEIAEKLGISTSGLNYCLKALIDKAGLAGTLADPSFAGTLLAPTDAAFQKALDVAGQTKAKRLPKGAAPPSRRRTPGCATPPTRYPSSAMPRL